MRNKRIYKKILSGIILLLAVICLAGCGGKDEKNEKDTEEQQSQLETEDEQQFYMIVGNDMVEEFLVLYSFDTGLELHYHYGFSTQFRDKYGGYTTATQFTPGRIVTIGTIDKEGYLTEIQLSNQIWEREKVKHFSIDEENGIFTIADKKYSIREGVSIFSNSEKISFSEISKDDILTVIGTDKKILSIIVTTGHGILSFSNTELFENSLLQLNENIFAMITKDMQMEISEGIYTLTVANNGWGSSTEIEVKRGEITEIDLDTLKGEGPKRGLISFRIDVENVEVYIDYEPVDHTQPVELTYGTHILEIKADGYNTWKKYLTVNSQEATVIIELEEDEESKGSENSEAESESESSTSESSETESQSEKSTDKNNTNKNSESVSESESSTNKNSEVVSESQSNTTESSETESESESSTSESNETEIESENTVSEIQSES